jgi:hypothetical protein
MAGALGLIKRMGTPATIEGSVPVETRVLMKRSAKSAKDPGFREAAWEGLIPASAGLISGNTLLIAGSRYLVQTADTDPGSGEIYWFAVKTNCLLTVWALQKTASNGNITERWEQLQSGIPAFGEMVTQALREEIPGLLEPSRFLFQVPRRSELKPMTRITVGRLPNGDAGWYSYIDGQVLRIEAVDDLGMSGVVRVQAGVDDRP